MSRIKIPTNFNIDLEFELPEFHRRLLAWVIDFVLLLFYILIIDKLYASLTAGMGSSKDDSYNASFLGLILFVPFILYHLLFEVFMNGQSPGKKVMGIKVINENGGRASISQFLLRWLLRSSEYTILMVIIYTAAGYLPVLLYYMFVTVVFLLADIICVVITEKSQRLGDMAAGTILIRTSNKGSLEETVFMDVDDSYIPAFPQVMQLSDRDMNSVKRILDSCRKNGNWTQAEYASSKIKTVLKINTSLASPDFLEALLKDYNYLSTK